MRRLSVVTVLAVAAALLAQASTGDGAPSASPKLGVLARGFTSPVMAVQAPGEPGRVYVVEQGGYVRVLKGRTRLAKPFLDLHAKISSGNEQGLLGIAFPPDYRKQQRVYANYTDPSGTTTIVEIPVRNGVAAAARARVLLRVTQPFSNHNGGNLVFGPDGLLWVGLGDGGSGGDPGNRSQNPGTLLGKLFTLDVNAASPKPKLVAIGLRNPWRYSFDRATGDLWIGDVGQNEVEEVDVVRKSTLAAGGLLNFGWNVYEGNQRYSSNPLGPGTLVEPVAEYTHQSGGCSVTGGFVYRGKAVPALRGRYLYGDYCSGTVWSIPANGGAPRVEPFTVRGLTSFGESSSGELYAVAQGGTIYRIVR